MTATVNKDGVIDFSPRNTGLLSIATITNMAARMLIDSQGKSRKLTQEFETRDRMNKLRASCGIEPEKVTMRIKMYSPEKA
jgi:hypothetical protein